MTVFESDLQLRADQICDRYAIARATVLLRTTDPFTDKPGGRVMGRAFYAAWRIWINSNQAEEQYLEVLHHEIAHLVAVSNGGRGHNRIWRKYARQIGAHPRACANTEQRMTALSKKGF